MGKMAAIAPQSKILRVSPPWIVYLLLTPPNYLKKNVFNTIITRGAILAENVRETILVTGFRGRRERRESYYSASLES